MIAFAIERITKQLCFTKFNAKLNWYDANNKLFDNEIISQEDFEKLERIRDIRNEIGHRDMLSFTESNQKQYLMVKSTLQFFFTFIDYYFVKDIISPTFLRSLD